MQKRTAHLALIGLAIFLGQIGCKSSETYVGPAKLNQEVSVEGLRLDLSKGEVKALKGNPGSRVVDQKWEYPRGLKLEFDTDDRLIFIKKGSTLQYQGKSIATPVDAEKACKFLGFSQATFSQESFSRTRISKIEIVKLPSGDELALAIHRGSVKQFVLMSSRVKKTNDPVLEQELD